MDWLTRFRAWRNRRIADPAFQRWAQRFPLTRGIADRHAVDLFQVISGFVQSQVLLALIRADLIAAAAATPLTEERIAELADLPPDGASILAEAASALDLFMRLPDGRFGLGARGASLAGNPALRRMIEHHHLFYRDMDDPLSLLRGTAAPTALSGFWPYATRDDPSQSESEGILAYSRLMAETQEMIADLVLDAYPMGRHRRLADIGGGQGVFLRHALARHKQLQGVLVDLPAVLDSAIDALADSQLGARITFHKANFFQDPLPSGVDLVTLVRILHDHDDGPAEALLRRIKSVLPPGGTLLIAEPLAETAGAEIFGEVYFSLYLKAMGSGRPRSFQRYRAMLTATGFADIREMRSASPFSVRVIQARC